MRTSTSRHHICWLFGLLVIQSVFLSCWQSTENTGSESPGTLSRSVDNLLLSADSLSPEALQDKISQLPEAFQDSFFIHRFQVLESAENDAAIKATLTVFNKVRPDDLLAKTLEHYYFGIFNQYAGKFDSAEIHYALATKGFEQLDSKHFLAQSLDKHSGNLATQGRTDSAIGMKLRAIDMLKEIGDTKTRMAVQMHLSNTYNLKGDFDQAIAVLEEPLVYYETQRDTPNIAYILGIKGSAYISKKDFPNALLFHKQALAMRQKAGPTGGITESLFHVGRTLIKMNQWQEALDTLRAAENALKVSSDKQGQAHIEASIGEALFNLGRFREADEYLMKSFDLSIKRKQYPAMALAANRLSAVRKSQNRFEEALQYLEQFAAFKDSVYDQGKNKLSRELSVKYETREKEFQISALKQENKLATERNWWIGGSLLLLSVVSFYALRMRATRERQRLQAENAKSEAQAMALTQKLEIQNLELASNRIRLEDYASMLIVRNQQLQDLTLQINLDNAHQNLEHVDDHQDLYNQVILTEADWEKFQAYFNKVHPGFIAKLRVQYPDLTPGEMRLVVLDKIGLSLKEASSILGISIDAVKKGRYRLKKKYNLEGDDLSRITQITA